MKRPFGFKVKWSVSGNGTAHRSAKNYMADPKVKAEISDKKNPRRNLYIHPDDWEQLKKAGNGNASAGIRKLLDDQK